MLKALGAPDAQESKSLTKTSLRREMRPERSMGTNPERIAGPFGLALNDGLPM